jgi:hypothetical protein
MLDLDERRFEFDLGMATAMPLVSILTFLVCSALLPFLWPDYGYLLSLMMSALSILLGWLLYPNISKDFAEVKGENEDLKVEVHNLKDALKKGAEAYAKLKDELDEAVESVPVPKAIEMHKKPQNAPVPPKTKKSGQRKGT